jgi:hypothetical protein
MSCALQSVFSAVHPASRADSDVSFNRVRRSMKGGTMRPAPSIPSAGRPKSSTAGPASNGKAMVAAALAVSLAPMARPRSNVRVASAMTAVAATGCRPSHSDQEGAGDDDPIARGDGHKDCPGRQAEKSHEHDCTTACPVGQPPERQREAEHADDVDGDSNRDRRQGVSMVLQRQRGEGHDHGHIALGGKAGRKGTCIRGSRRKVSTLVAAVPSVPRVRGRL